MGGQWFSIDPPSAGQCFRMGQHRKKTNDCKQEFPGDKGPNRFSRMCVDKRPGNRAMKETICDGIGSKPTRHFMSCGNRDDRKLLSTVHDVENVWCAN
jgi:hypothetical protein